MRSVTTIRTRHRRGSPDVIHFGPWANGAIGIVAIGSESPLSAPLTLDEDRFVFSVLDGETSWAVTDQELVIAKRAVGSIMLTSMNSTKR